LPERSCGLRIGESAGTYQKTWEQP
jgi:hypothetical protein